MKVANGFRKAFWYCDLLPNEINEHRRPSADFGLEDGAFDDLEKTDDLGRV